MVGEVRGGEASDLLDALSTGHGGSLSTIHANGAVLALPRLAECVLQGCSEGQSMESICQRVVHAVDFVVHVERDEQGRGGVEAVEVEGYDLRWAAAGAEPQSYRKRCSPGAGVCVRGGTRLPGAVCGLVAAGAAQADVAGLADDLDAPLAAALGVFELRGLDPVPVGVLAVLAADLERSPGGRQREGGVVRLAGLVGLGVLADVAEQADFVAGVHVAILAKRAGNPVATGQRPVRRR